MVTTYGIFRVWAAMSPFRPISVRPWEWITSGLRSLIISILFDGYIGTKYPL